LPGFFRFVKGGQRRIDGCGRERCQKRVHDALLQLEAAKTLALAFGSLHAMRLKACVSRDVAANSGVRDLHLAPTPATTKQTL
jgi:hypothetical protein